MLNNLRMFSLVPLSILLIGCATTVEEDNKMNNEPGALDLILCEEPRPQICTREYDPVCASLLDGTLKTYSTGCTSCSDSNVIGYEPGEC